MSIAMLDGTAKGTPILAKRLKHGPDSAGELHHLANFNSGSYDLMS